MSKNILITGACGFVGSRLSIALNSLPNCNVVGVDNRNPSDALKNNTKQTTWLNCDVRNEKEMDKILSETRFNTVIHLAAYYDFTSSWSKEYQEINVNATNKIWELCNQNNVGHFIFSSSISSVNPKKYSKITEESHADCSNVLAYGKSKAESESSLENLSLQLSCPDILATSIVRFAGVYSDWVELPPIHALFLLWKKQSWPFCTFIPGKGETGMPFIHISDLVECLVRLIHSEPKKRSYQQFLGSGNGSTSQNQLYSAIQTKYSPTYISIPFVEKSGDLLYSCKNLLSKLDEERASSLMPGYLVREFGDIKYDVDASFTHNYLDWKPTRNIIDDIPQMIKLFESQPSLWTKRNLNRNIRQFQYYNKE